MTKRTGGAEAQGQQRTVDPKVMADLWASFEAAVIPAVAGRTQRKEMKLAFYGGAAGLLGKIMCMIDPGQEPTERDLLQMSAIQDELDTFVEGVRAEARSRTH